MLKRGRMRAWTTIEKPGTGFDEGGQPIGSDAGWTFHGNAWADIVFLTGRATIAGDTPLNEMRASIRYEYRTDLVPGMRISGEGYVFDVQAVLPDLQKREYVDLPCIVGVTNG